MRVESPPTQSRRRGAVWAQKRCPTYVKPIVFLPFSWFLHYCTHIGCPEKAMKPIAFLLFDTTTISNVVSAITKCSKCNKTNGVLAVVHDFGALLDSTRANPASNGPRSLPPWSLGSEIQGGGLLLNFLDSRIPGSEVRGGC